MVDLIGKFRKNVVINWLLSVVIPYLIVDKFLMLTCRYCSGSCLLFLGGCVSRAAGWF